MTAANQTADDLELEVGADDPFDHGEAPAFARYNALDHVSHFTGVSMSIMYLIAAGVTLYEVFSRYVLNAPTLWAFDIVLVLVAASWMLSSGYITLKNRHIGITVFHVMASNRTRWWLDAVAMVVGIFALFMLLADAAPNAWDAILKVDKTGDSFNSPRPMMHEALLVLGAMLYMAQLLVNFHRHTSSPITKLVVKIFAAFAVVYFLSGALAEFVGEETIFGAIRDVFSSVADALNPRSTLELRANLGTGGILLLMVVMLVGLMMTGMALGIVTLFVAVTMAFALFGPNGLFIVSTATAALLEKYTLVAIPFFVLMASILERSGIAEDLFDAMSVFAGNLRGGVAVQTTVVAIILAAMSGVMGGEIVMLGLVALPQMLRLGYDTKLTIGLICAAGALATLIPPSIIMIFYGLSAEVSIGDLFLAGTTPGLLLAALYVTYVLVRVNLNPKLAPTAKEVAALTGERQTLSRARLIAVFLCILLIAAVMGSIYAGIASVTESAAVGCLGAMFVAAVRNEFKWSVLSSSLMGTMTTVGTIIWLVLGAVSFVGIINRIGGERFMADLLTSLDLPALGIIFAMMLILVVLGTFMEWIAIVLITVPVFAPVVEGLAPELGLTVEQAKVWFGILFVMNIQIYFLSPPFGPACFWLKSVAPKEITLQQIFASVLPFIALQIIGLALVVMFPQVALWLPEAFD